MKISIYIIIIITFFACNNDDALPKPTGLLRLEFPKAKYEKAVTNPYQFETNKIAKVRVNSKNWMKINYPNIKATIDITYIPVENNILKLLKDTEKLTTKHAVKADEIYYDAFENKDEKVFGKLSNVTGNAASSIQFYVTDSTKHFITGALYFNTQPNYDSIYPSIKYIEKDIIRLMNTTKWKN